MFNRQPYNIGKFNIPAQVAANIEGISVMRLGAPLVNASLIIVTSGFTNLTLRSEGLSTLVFRAKGDSELRLSSATDGTKILYAEGIPSEIVMTTSGTQVLSGEETITLEGLVLMLGDELIINTCDMTITINGQNGMRYLSDDSTFFNLLSGNNTIIYEDNAGNRQVSLDVIWRDRWL